MSSQVMTSLEDSINDLAEQWMAIMNDGRVYTEAQRLIAFATRLSPNARPIEGDVDSMPLCFHRRGGWMGPFMPCRVAGMDLDHLLIFFGGQMIEVTYEQYVYDYVVPLSAACRKTMGAPAITSLLRQIKALNRPAELIFFVTAESMAFAQSTGMVPGMTHMRTTGIDVAAGTVPAAIRAIEALAVPADRTEMGCPGDNGVYLASIEGERTCVFVRHHEDGRKEYTYSGGLSRRLYDALGHAGYEYAALALSGVKLRKINAVRQGAVRPRHFICPFMPTGGRAVMTNKKMDHLLISPDKIKNNLDWSGIVYC